MSGSVFAIAADPHAGGRPPAPGPSRQLLTTRREPGRVPTRPLRALAAAFASFLLASCGAAPETMTAGRPDLRDAETEPAGDRRDEPGAPAAGETPELAAVEAEPGAAPERLPADDAPPGDPAGKERDEVFYSIAAEMKAGSAAPPLATEPDSETDARVLARPEAAGQAAPGPGGDLGAGTTGGLGAYPEESLLSELDVRFGAEWIALSGGIGNPGAEEADPRREEAARRLIALAAIRPPQETGPLTEALAFAMNDRRKTEHKLLAAAYLEMQGRGEEARQLIAALAGGSTGGAPAEKPEGTFQLAGLAFARSIDGPGKFTSAPPAQVAPGKTVLIYGEFRNFLSLRDDPGAGKEPTYRRSFAGSLKLLSPSGEEIDRLEFLPEGRGKQEAALPKEIVNFWARYRIPPTLKPGKHRIVIEARDVLAGETASGAIEFDV